MNDFEQLIEKEFKWVSPLTGGETSGIIKKITKSPGIPCFVSTFGNVYPVNECTVKFGDSYVKVKINE